MPLTVSDMDQLRAQMDQAVDDLIREYLGKGLSVDDVHGSLTNASDFEELKKRQ